MESLRNIKHRMHIIQNTQQITRAMEAVSATKMRRSQEFALNARPYAQHALWLLSNVSRKTLQKIHPLLQKKKANNRICLIVIASDKGLCGGYNSGILKKTHPYITTHLDKSPDNSIDIITVGKKARDYFKFRKLTVMAEFIDFGDYIKIEQTMPFAQKIIKTYLEKKYDSIMCAYTNFVSTLKQQTVIRQILPITKQGIEKIVQGIAPKHGRYASSPVTTSSDPELVPPFNYEYKFEPSSEKVLNQLLPLLVKVQIHHMILEANASEHSARMIAMKNASENAETVLAELTLFYNKARQALITKEITEVIAGREALE